MAHHIMAVCVVCLLCAQRVPCQDHFADLLQQSSSNSISSNDITATILNHSELNAKVYPRAEQYTRQKQPSSETTDSNSRSSRSSSSSNIISTADPSHNPLSSSRSSSSSSSHHRSKRHAGHAHDEAHSMPEITEYFLKRIISNYGVLDESNDAPIEAGYFSKRAFHRLISRLGLQQLINSSDRNDTCIGDSKLVQHVQPHDLSHHHHSHQHQQHLDELSIGNCTLLQQQDPLNSVLCMPIEEAQHQATAIKNYTLSRQDLLNLCPVLLYQLSATTTAERDGCIEPAVLAEIDSLEHHNLNADKDDILYVWIYAFISVLACGILGLVGVAIIPFMDSRYYKHIIQYLVSLAVGTMTGDALLHLLPHSLAGQSERNMIFKGLTCMGGIIFFYITEHGLTMISEWRKSIEKKESKKKPSRAKVMRDPDSSVNNSVAGDKMCKQKYSSYPYCYDEIAMDSHKQDVWMHLPGDGAPECGTGGAASLRNGKAEHDGTTESAAAAQSLLSTSHNNYAEMNNHQHQHNHNHQHQHEHEQQQAHLHDSNTISTDLDGQAMGDGLAVANGAAAVAAADAKDKDAKSNDTVTVILREHESSHHGHSHRHGHVHSPPESLSAVAWMIIMGDGLHNFTDGMAIGAAFAENIAGGFSTSLAVFCHELPHELGDFAILMKAGMSVKSAVYYNLLTGVLSFIGMIFGIVFGQSQEAAQWMFAAAAGLFIYIALVDMMPEISAAHKSLEQFALQILGMLSGVFIMLIIAIYEGDLMTVFATTPVAGHHQHVH